MDNGVREENSSSPNVNIFVHRIRRGTDGTTCTVVLSEGSSFLVFSRAAEALVAGSELSGCDLQRLADASGELAAFKKGLELCARREHSVFQLRVKLESRGFRAGQVNTALKELKAINAVNDRRFAEAWIRSKSSKNRNKKAAGLHAAGITPGLINELLEQYHAPDLEYQLLDKNYTQLLQKTSMTAEKRLQVLVRRGFGYSEIRAYLRNRDSQAGIPDAFD